MPKRPLTMHQTIISSSEWTAWREVNDFPTSPYRNDIKDAEMTSYFTPRHWRAFANFITQAQSKKYKKLKIKINEYYKK